MSTNIVDTIIIGAGISGLACAKKLQENGRDFMMVSENIGGRILTSFLPLKTAQQTMERSSSVPTMNMFYNTSRSNRELS